METPVSIADPGDAASRPVPRPRRRLGAPPPAPADPTPWRTVFGAPALTAAEEHVLMSRSVRHAVSAGQSLLDTHEPADALMLLVSGDAVLGSRGSDGALRTELSLTGPAWLDVSSAWLGLPHVMEAQALSDVVVARLPLAALLSELPTQPQLAMRLCQTLALQVHRLTGAARNLLHNDAPARFAEWLLLRCQAPGAAGTAGEPPCAVHLQQRKRDIAQQLAMTPETLSRLFRQFETQGVIHVQGYDLTVLDLAGLQALAGKPAD
jgi:CRP-like cAMP-binding protein